MATKTQNIQYQLDDWSREYGLDHLKISFRGYKNLNHDRKIVFGRCNYLKDPTRCVIMIGEKFEDRPLGWLETSVLWHEFCHANAYIEDGKSDGHNKHWRRYRRRKVKYWIGEYVAEVVYLCWYVMFK